MTSEDFIETKQAVGALYSSLLLGRTTVLITSGQASHPTAIMPPAISVISQTENLCLYLNFERNLFYKFLTSCIFQSPFTA